MTATTDRPPGRTIGDRVVDVLENHSWVVWIGLAGLLHAFLSFGPYNTVGIRGAAMSPLLTSDGVYLSHRAGDALCVGDALTAPHPATKDAIAIRMVMALGGDRVVFDDTGYRIAGRATPMSAAWVAAARERSGDAFVVPANEVMLRRVDPDAADAPTYEAFFTVAAHDVDSVIVRALWRTEQSFWAHVPRPQTRCVSIQGNAT